MNLKKQKLLLLIIGITIAIILSLYLYRNSIKKWFSSDENFYYFYNDEDTCMICLEGSNYINTEEGSPDFGINYGELKEVCTFTPLHKAHNICISKWIIEKARSGDLGECPACRNNLKLIYYLAVSQYLINNQTLERFGYNLRSMLNQKFNMSNEQISNFKRENRDIINQIEQSIIKFNTSQQPQSQQVISDIQYWINLINQYLPLLRQRNFRGLLNSPEILNMIEKIRTEQQLRDYLFSLPDAQELQTTIAEFIEFMNQSNQEQIYNQMMNEIIEEQNRQINQRELRRRELEERRRQMEEERNQERRRQMEEERNQELRRQMEEERNQERQRLRQTSLNSVRDANNISVNTSRMIEEELRTLLDNDPSPTLHNNLYKKMMLTSKDQGVLNYIKQYLELEEIPILAKEKYNLFIQYFNDRSKRARESLEKEMKIIDQGLSMINEYERKSKADNIKREKEVQKMKVKDEKEIKELEKQIKENKLKIEFIKKENNSKTMYTIVGGVVVLTLAFVIYKAFSNKKRR
jgi:hypothetical protein